MHEHDFLIVRKHYTLVYFSELYTRKILKKKIVSVGHNATPEPDNKNCLRIDNFKLYYLL